MEPYQQPIQPQPCPTCGGELFCSTDLRDRGDSLDPGDYAICEYCGGFLVMGSEGRVSAVSNDVVSNDKRFAPSGIAHMFEVQRAVRANARLFVSDGPTGTTVTLVPPIDGQKTVRSPGSN